MVVGEGEAASRPEEDEEEEEEEEEEGEESWKRCTVPLSLAAARRVPAWLKARE
jgi:hypothetical protein